jgi:deazaflavin-dependent oxidoreductase (nitroreductase family)
VARVANPVINLLVRLGLKPSGAHTLIVKGRKSGKARTMPVNPLDYEGKRYLVAPRGSTEWARNLRAAGTARLRSGRSTISFEATELPVAARPPIIRAYLDRWANVTARQFGVEKDASLKDLEAIAGDHPVFEIREVFPINAS